MHRSSPAQRDSGNERVSVNPRALGAALDAVGSSGFASAITAFVMEQVAGDAVHLECWRADADSASGYRVEWLGSGGARQAELYQIMDAYYRDYALDDPLFTPVRGRSGTLLLLRHVDGLAKGEFRRRFFDAPQITQECVRVHGDAHVQYAIALTRSREHAPFSTHELFHFRQMADVLLPVCALHARLHAAWRVTGTPAAQAAPRGGFDARVARHGVPLSPREHDVCRLLLSGLTVPEAADQLRVKQSTAQSYVQRAFEKLGVRTRRALFDWALVDD
jgi:LuxR family transcriptional regulator, activator of tox operons